MGTIFGRPSSKIWESQKTSKFRRDFRQLSTSIANISRMDRHTEHLKNLINHNSFCVGERNLVNFGPQSKKVLDVHTDPPK